MARSGSYSRSRTRRGSRRPPTRVVAASVGALLVLLTVLLVLLPVLGLVGAVAGAGPVVDIPWTSLTVLTVLGLLLALGCLVLAFMTYRPRLSWSLAVLAWVLSLLASVWPIVATADAAVDGVREIVPFIVGVVRDVAG